MPAPQIIRAESVDDMEQIVASYISDGYQVEQKTESSRILIKKKNEKKPNWRRVASGVVFFRKPMIHEVADYFTAEDVVIEVRLASSPPPYPYPPPTHVPLPTHRISMDGYWWWTGNDWVPRMRWNGWEWVLRA